MWRNFQQTYPGGRTMANASVSEASYAGEYIRSLLTGSPPNGTPLEGWREHRDIIEALEQAHSAGGTAAVRRAIVGIMRRHPALISLVARNGSNDTVSVWLPPKGWPVLHPDALYGLAGELTVAIL